MKAIAVCPKCGQKLASDCRGCVKGGTDVHKCKGMKRADVVDKIKWKIIEEN